MIVVGDLVAMLVDDSLEPGREEESRLIVCLVIAVDGHTVRPEKKYAKVLTPDGILIWKSLYDLGRLS